jgi:hypothetical protein
MIIFKTFFNKYDGTFSTGSNWLQVIQNSAMYCAVEQLVAFQELLSPLGYLLEEMEKITDWGNFINCTLHTALLGRVREVTEKVKSTKKVKLSL